MANLKHSLINDVLFIHGFNVTFASAAMRTAQMAFDLNEKNPGLTFMYTWPSQGELDVEAYMADESTAGWAERHLRQYLELLLTRADIDKINVIWYAFCLVIRYD